MRLFLSIILLVSIAQVNATDVLKVGISNKHSEVFNTNGKVLIGTATKPFQCILDRTDYAYKLVSIPHARLQKELISGSIDIGMPLAKSESRDKFALFSNTVIEVKFYLIFDSKYQFTDLEKYPVATVRTGKNNSEFELKNYTLFEVTDWKSAIGMLKKQRVASIRMPLPIYQEYKNQLRGYEIKYLSSEKVGLYVSNLHKKSDELLNSLNRSISQCRLK